MREIKNAFELEGLLKGDKPVLLDFYADWCGPCQTLLPIVDDLAKKHQEDVEIVKVNVDKNQGIALEFGVKSIPALFFIKDGDIKERLVGLQTKSELDRKIHHYAESAA